MDNQTALAVQSLLDSQSSVQDPSANGAEEDDVFQCGKCKKQFTNLPNFMAHKRERCVPVGQANHGRAVVTASTPGTSPNSAFTSSVQHHALNRQVSAYPAPVPPSPLTHVSQNMSVLSEDMLMSTFTSMDQTTLPIQSTAFQSAPMQATSFLSQAPQQRTTSGPAAVQAVQHAGFTTVNTAALTSTVQTIHPTHIIHVQQPAQAAQITQISSAPITKQPSPPKQTQQHHPTPSSRPNVSVITDVQNAAKRRRNGSQDPSKKLGKLKCTYCDKTFNKNFDLQQHIRSHTGEKPFQCIVCGRAFAQKSNVKKHMQTHKVWPQGTGNTLPKQPPPKPLDKDDEEQQEREEEEEEVVTPVEPEVVVEPEKDKEEEEDEEENKDDKLNIMVDNSYLCQYCPSNFKTYFQLKTHMIQHKNEQVYKCILKSCGSTFKDLDSFLEHTKFHENDMSYRCHLCNKHFPSLYDLGVHQYSHSLYPNQGPKPGPRYFRCTKCMNKYATPEALDHHMATSSHTYPCPHCDKTFPCERYLRRHLPVHGTLGEHVCTHCEKRFKTEHYLKMHMLIHTGVKPFKCSQCEAAFNRKDKLKRHMLIHDPVKKFKCPFRTHMGCTKEFNRPDKLKAHIIAHSGIKPFKCQYCNKSFSRKPHMLEHERMHTDNYTIRCDKCKKGFAREKYLKEHKCRPGREAKKTKELREDRAGDEDITPNTVSSKRRTAKVKEREKVEPTKRNIRKRGRPPRKVTKIEEVVPEVEESTSAGTDDIQKDLELIKAQMNQSKNSTETETHILTASELGQDVHMSAQNTIAAASTPHVTDHDGDPITATSLQHLSDGTTTTTVFIHQATGAAALGAATSQTEIPIPESTAGETATSLLEGTSISESTDEDMPYLPTSEALS
ncbi:zinc finger protein 341-like isoform X2 [Glandiceps talaboti]